MATKAEAIKASFEYFGADPDYSKLPADVFVEKYALVDAEGDYKETSPDQMHKRLAREFARIEANYKNPMSEDEIYGLLKDFKYVIPQGSPMAGIGNPYQTVSLSNCFVLPSSPVVDSYGGIMLADQEIVQASKRRCGVGLSISGIRPRGTVTSNASRTSDGIGIFMERFSNSIREVGQCIAAGERVLTKRGLIAIEDVVAGSDAVWTKMGWVQVLSVEANGEKEIVELRTQRGYAIRATADHIVLNGDAEETRIGDLDEEDLVALLLGPSTGVTKQPVALTPAAITDPGTRTNWNVRQPSELNSAYAYLIGYAYGNGSVECTSIGRPYTICLCVPTAWPDIKARVVGLIEDQCGLTAHIRPATGAAEKIGITSTVVLAQLEQNGLLKTRSGDITLPAAVVASPPDVQAAFFAGYFDADGYASGRKKGYSLSSISREMLVGVQKILLANGIVSRLHAEVRIEPGWNTLWSLNITGASAQRRLLEWCGAQSVKIGGLGYIAERDNVLTPWTTHTLGVGALQNGRIASHPQKLSVRALEQVRMDGRYPLPVGTLVTDSVAAVTPKGTSPTYDLVLESEHLFWCEGFYVHNSGRRGAGMLTLSVHHPDIRTFIQIKKDRQKVTGANCSIQLTDEFMQAVKDDTMVQLRWPVDNKVNPQIQEFVRAKEIWDLIIDAAHFSAEPGLLYWSTVIRESIADCYADVGFRTDSTNPCQPAWATVLTPEGIRTFADIDVGSTIWSGKQWTKVVRKVHTGQKQVNRYATMAGEFVGTVDHQVFQDGTRVKARDAAYIDACPPPPNSLLVPHTTDRDESAVRFNVAVGIEDVWDITVDAPEHSYWTGGLLVSNCGEIPLSPGDSCRLLVSNLLSFVKRPFTPNAAFDFELFAQVVRKAQRLMDDLVDLEIEAVERIIVKIRLDPEPPHVKAAELAMWEHMRDVAVKGRRTGLGITALGDTLAALGLKYGSSESIELAGRIYQTNEVNSWKASCLMAKERGTFPIFDFEKEKGHVYLNRVLAVDTELAALYAKYGRRNIANTTTAPVGSVSTVALASESKRLFGTTSGIEPAYLVEMDRFRKVPAGTANIARVDAKGDHWVKYTVYHPSFRIWRELTGNEDLASSPFGGALANEIDWVKGVDLQAACQRWISHSISKTINLPSDVSKDVVSSVYMRGWETGCKGLTVYRDGCRDGVLVAKDAKPANSEGFPQHRAPKRPTELPCEVQHVKVKGEPWTVIVGLMEGKPYELFGGKLAEAVKIPKSVTDGVLVKVSHGKTRPASYDLKSGLKEDGTFEHVFTDITSAFENPTEGSFTRAISVALRHGADVQFVVEQLIKGESNSDLFSLSKVLARTLKHYIKDGAKASSDKKCLSCGAEELVYKEGCVSCSCGYSKC